MKDLIATVVKTYGGLQELTDTREVCQAKAIPFSRRDASSKRRRDERIACRGVAGRQEVRVLTMLPLLTRELDKSSFGKTQRPVPDFRHEFLSPLKNHVHPLRPGDRPNGSVSLLNHRRFPFPLFRSRRSKVQYQTKCGLYNVHVNLKRRRKYEFTTFPVITA